MDMSATRPRLVRPDLAADPVGAVIDAHRTGALLALATGGTTADPRAVVRTTESWWRSFDGYSELTGIASGARVWVPGPLRATMNLFASVHARVVGAEMVAGPATATHACLTPAQLDRRAAELPAGATAVVAGAVLPPEGRRQRTVHYYGAAELSFVAAGTHGADLRAFPGADIEIRAGEIWVRSPYLCEGYDGPVGSLRRDDEGWATVGDLGSYDDRVLRVLGRPDAIITAGATVVIAEVESSLRPVAGAPFAVYGMPHPTMGALVAVALTDEADRPALEAHAREHLPVSHRPRHWRVVGELPLTEAGKVDRRRLADG